MSSVETVSPDVKVEWNPNSETDLAGYKVYHGTESGNYLDEIDVGNVTTAEIYSLVKGTTYFFAVTAYNTEGVESDLSEEVSLTLELYDEKGTITISFTRVDDLVTATVAEEGELIDSVFLSTLAVDDQYDLSFTYRGKTVTVEK